jgi:glycosyltransferase involved in cell wall biosynthesis
MDCVLTTYPISRDFDQRLCNIVSGDVMKLSVAELRQRTPLRMLAYLRSLRVNRLFLPIEDENGSTLLPVLKLLAAVVPAKSVLVVTPDLAIVQTSRINALLSLARLAHATMVSRLAVNKARNEVAQLLHSDILKVEETTSRNVLYLNANLWFGVKAGGSVGHISGVVNALDCSGYAVHFVSAGGRLMVKDHIAYSCLVPARHFGAPWEYNYYRFHFDAVRQTTPIIEQTRFSFIYQRLSIANYSGVVLSRKRGIPLVLEYNGSEAWVARNWGRPLRQQRLAEQVEDVNLRHAHLIVTISDVLRDELMERGVSPERIVTYPNCIDPEMFDPTNFSAEQIKALRNRHGISAKAVVVTFIGTFGQWHGIEVLAQAVRHLIDNHRSWLEAKKVHFLLVGDGLKMPEVRSILRNHVQGPFVTLAGLVPQHEAPLYLASSDVLCSPHVRNADGTKFFGSPTKLFEYMAMGKGIVGSRLDQIGEVLTPYLDIKNLPTSEPQSSAPDLAVLGEPGDVDDLVRGIQFLVNREDWRKRLGANARGRALRQYTWAHHVDAILTGLSRNLGAKKA